jgi:hypothetical protein
MTQVFVVCAAVGATVLVLQFILSLIGLGGEHELSHDVGGADHDLGGGDVHGDVAHDGDSGGDHAETQHSAAGAASHGGIWLLRALSLRTVVTALAFFGLTGIAAQAADCSPSTTLLTAAAAGVGSLYAVYFMLCSMKSLQAEGTARIHRALGKEGTVYLHVPGHRQGRGKIQINLQNRTVEYQAVTAGETIPSGATVIVQEVLGSDLVQVEPVATRSVSEAR